MSNFIQFKEAVQKQFEEMSSNKLFVTDVDKDTIYETYLNSFKSGTNPIYKERTEHDCQCCRSFLRNSANVVSIVDNKLVSIWDITVEKPYQVVADALSALAKSRPIKDVFLHFENHLGTDHNHQLLESGQTKKWDHFHYKLPSKFVKTNDSIPTILGDKRSSKDVFKRGLTEISLDSIDTVLELINQNSLYRGKEKEIQLVEFSKLKRVYLRMKNLDNENDTHIDNYCWSKSLEIGGLSKLRNTSLGTLLTDISEGVELEQAVKKFEKMVAPANYKRPTALVTKGMIKKAQEKVEELGIADSLERRYAVIEDIAIGDILFANRDIKKAMNVFDELESEVSDKIANIDKIEEVPIDTFITNILPKATSIEVMIEDKHKNNTVSLIAPVHSDAKNILKWDNNFSWSYAGNVTDSMKDNVKKAGGNVDGILRFSIQWNEDGNNKDDLDAHCKEPNGNHIDFNKKGRKQTSSGMLDVDITQPRGVAVENIIWTNKSKMMNGTYQFYVHNYSCRGGVGGFRAEIEYNGIIYSYDYQKTVKQDEIVKVASIIFDKNRENLNFTDSMVSKESKKQIDGTFKKVSMIMNSPNHWHGKAIGNKHLFFMIDGYKSEEKPRGFFNEFLSNELTEHRKVFEVLGGKMKVEDSEEQLTGLGFSSTKRDSVYLRVRGSFNRVIKVKF